MLLKDIYLSLTRVFAPRWLKSDVSPTARVNFRRVNTRNFCKLSVGSGSLVSAQIIFERENAKIKIGHSTFIGASKLIAAEDITIGNDVLISWGVTIVDHDSHSVHWPLRARDVANWYVGVKDWAHVKIRGVKIGDRVWIGFGATVLKGVSIGEGAVVGAGSVVRENIPAFAVAVGNPAKVVRFLQAGEGQAGEGTD
jgi:acetyltransferase-like isoleucine patch superfamily enzyme